MIKIEITDPGSLSEGERDALIRLLADTAPAEYVDTRQVDPGLVALMQATNEVMKPTQYVGPIDPATPGVKPAPPAPPTEPDPSLHTFADGTVAHAVEMPSVILPADNPEAATIGFGGPLPTGAAPAPSVPLPPPVPSAVGHAPGSNPTPPVLTPAPLPTGQVAASSPPAPTNTLDKRGYPWDPRIHSGNKAINQTDGNWRQKRGVSPELVTQVETEIAALIAIPAPGTVPRPPPVPGAGMPPPPPVDTDPTFANAIADLSAWMAAKRITNDDITAAIQAVAPGVGSIGVLKPRLDLVRAVHDALRIKAGA